MIKNLKQPLHKNYKERMCNGAYEDVSETYRAKISPERRVLHGNTLYCIAIHNTNRLSAL